MTGLMRAGKLDSLFAPLGPLEPPGPEVTIRPDDYDDLFSGRGLPRLFLGTYDEQGVIEALGRYGVTQRLIGPGCDRLAAELHVPDPRHQTVRVFGVGPEGRALEPFIELTVHEGLYSFDRSVWPDLDRPFRLLVVQWIRLQDPRARFSAQRPQLPGQSHPGLGLGRVFMQMVLALARRIGVDGVINCPEFIHNAILYAGFFRFADPRAEGRLTALLRDLGHLPLPTLAWAVTLGCVSDEQGSTGFGWYQGKQVEPVHDRLVAAFRAERYDRIAREEKFTAAFAFDGERYRALDPIRPDFTARY